MTDFSARRTMMVDTQVRPSDVTKFPIIDAMLSVAREDFVPAARREAAYVGENLDLGQGRVVLEPRTLAKMLDTLAIGPEELVLDIGCGLGYSTAVIARLAQAVVAVEADEAYVREAQDALAASGVDNAVVQAGDMAAGAAEHGPYDVIVLQGGVMELPDALLDQLKEGGRIAALFMHDALGEVRVGHKRAGQISWRLAFNASAPVLPGFARARAFSL
ncbi:protein-L-isoaspartate O-methyltransferase [Sulfitobacter albidus]|uniref:Protein-L-isoaspartate O-methyltransferase n=1 Tax=Sulfitobacter albidus TaxID=2829501 RepID=A0A975JBB0_9RHOB|nr:protein-L-isoaspartate O-methyltransferase [Sulfitobacter albidus]QUJ75278.1 protein-L-isoaspartate O-methyltransferase [Sulfitobacter albidus]